MHIVHLTFLCVSKTLQIQEHKATPGQYSIDFPSLSLHFHIWQQEGWGWAPAAGDQPSSGH